MYPSFTTTTLDPRMYSSLYNHNNNTNLSKTHREDYCPPSSSSFQLPSPQYINLDDGMIFNELMLQESLFSDDHSNHNANDIAVHQQFASNDDIRASLQPAMVECNNNNGDDGFKKPKNSSKSRRSSKNDRHSKINTARGPRDRRMRLSLDVGKKFFKLQDMLGFDKPSKTVEWLLMKSKSNIQELISHGKSSFLSTIFSESSTSNLSEFIDGDHKAKSSSSSTRKAKKKMSRGVRKSAYLLRPLAKKTREMARKRARERTLEKSGKLACVSGGDDKFVACFNGGDDQFAKIRPCFDQTMDRDTNCLGPWVINQPEQSSSSSMIGSWSPSLLFDYQQTGVHHQEHQLNDFQILGNLWEVKN